MQVGCLTRRRAGSRVLPFGLQMIRLMESINYSSRCLLQTLKLADNVKHVFAMLRSLAGKDSFFSLIMRSAQHGCNILAVLQVTCWLNLSDQTNIGRFFSTYEPFDCQIGSLDDTILTLGYTERTLKSDLSLESCSQREGGTSRLWWSISHISEGWGGI